MTRAHEEPVRSASTDETCRLGNEAVTVREPESQLRARQAIERVLDRRLRLYELEPNGDDSLDYIDELNEVFEMKDVTSEEFRELRKRRLRWCPSTKLAMYWSVLLDAPTLGDRFSPMPDYPDDDPESIAAIEAEGLFTVKRKAEREAEWRERQRRDIPVPRIREREARALERHFLVLEQAGITNTREAEPRTREQLHALAHVRRLTHWSVCIAREPFDGEAGIEIKVGWGYNRTGRPDTLAFRLQSWLKYSDKGSNLRDSLRRSDFALRHGVLTFDSSEPEFWSAQGAGLDFVPTLELILPSEIDVLWCLVGRVLLRYGGGQGWQSFDASPSHP